MYFRPLCEAMYTYLEEVGLSGKFCILPFREDTEAVRRQERNVLRRGGGQRKSWKLSNHAQPNENCALLP